MKLVGDGFEDCEMVKPPKRKGGFAVLDPAKHRELSSKGDKSAHAKGKAHRWSIEEAKAAGRKGGLATAAADQEAREVVSKTMFDGPEVDFEKELLGIKPSVASRTLEMFNPPRANPADVRRWLLAKLRKLAKKKATPR